jgi:hypothetical protein
LTWLPKCIGLGSLFFSFMKKFCLFVTLCSLGLVLNAQYISKVHEYKPGPGQWTNESPWGTPQSANSIIGGLQGALCLGAFGGYVIFEFDEPVKNHADNPYGVDFMIFGNPLKNMSNPSDPNNVGWAEPGIVSVMKDENGNGKPDDTWYELAGSDYYFSSTQKNYQVTYTNPGGTVAKDVPYSDNLGHNGAIISNGFHNHNFYPLQDSFPGVGAEEYTLQGTCLKSHVHQSVAGVMVNPGRPWGYADNTLRGYYNGLPDNPYTLNTEEGSGGDAFDIHWAVDDYGNYVDLDEIHFVKVHTAMLDNGSVFGEVSTEITGAAIVEADKSVSGITTMVVIQALPDTITGNAYQLEAFAFNMGRRVENEKLIWNCNTENASVNENQVLEFNQSGKLTLTVALENNPEIQTICEVQLVYDPNGLGNTKARLPEPELFPNPAMASFQIKGSKGAEVQLFTLSGEKVLEVKPYCDGKRILVDNLPPGMYLVKIIDKDFSYCKKLIVK